MSIACGVKLVHRTYLAYRGVGVGGAGVAIAPPDFGRSVSTILNLDGQIMSTTLLLASPPVFSDLPTALD